MPWAAIASAVAPTIIGGLMGSEGSSQSQTQQNTIDPRMAKYLYGENGNGGLLSEAQNWYNNNKTGLNPQMLQGLNSQWNVLTNPETMGAYQQMSRLGSGLMSAPIAGNPFTDGRASLSGGSPNLGMGQRSQGGMGGGMGGGMPQMQTMQGGGQGDQTGGFDPRASGGSQGGMQGGAGGGSIGQGSLTLDQYSPAYRFLMSLGEVNPDGSLNIQGENGIGMQAYRNGVQPGGTGWGGSALASSGGNSPMQSGLLSGGGARGGMSQGGGMPQFQSFRNEGIGQPMPQQSPFTQPEWVSKPAAATTAAAVEPNEEERQRQAQLAAAMANRY